MPINSLFDMGQIIGLQNDVRDRAPTIIRYSPQTLHNIKNYQFMIINPIKEHGSRTTKSITSIQGFTIEHDYIPKSLQRDWVKAIFPEDATVAMDSGGKSIHHHFRLTRSITKKEKEELDKRLKKAFPLCDHGVLTNIAGLVRTPGATRPNGNIQQVYNTSRRYTYEEIFNILEKIDSQIKDRFSAQKIISCGKIIYDGGIKRKGKIVFPVDSQECQEALINNATEGIEELLQAGYSLREGSIVYIATKSILDNFTDINKLIINSKAQKEHAALPAPKTRLKKPARKHRKAILDKLANIPLIEILREIAPRVKDAKKGKHHVVWCPFHEDSNYSAWISSKPGEMEYYFCSVDSCEYFYGRTHGVNVIDLYQIKDGLSNKEAINKLIGEYPMCEIEKEPLELDDIEVPEEIDFFVEDLPGLKKLSAGEEAEKLWIIDVLMKCLKEIKHLNIQAAQASGKSYACAVKAVARIVSSLCTIIFSRSHDELNQIERHIKLKLIENGLSTDHVFHLRGASMGSDEQSSREFPSIRPVIILAPYAYLKRKDDSIYVFELLKMIHDQEFEKDLTVIIDECASFIDGNFYSYPLGARYDEREINGYMKRLPIKECRLQNRSGNCKNCHELMGLTSNVVRGYSIKFSPPGQHDANDNFSNRLLHVNIDQYVCHELEMADKTMTIEPIYSTAYDKMRKDRRKNREVLIGGKRDNIQGVLITPQNFLEDTISYSYFPHIVKYYPYQQKCENRLKRPLNEKELQEREEEPQEWAFPKNTCCIPYLQGWDTLALDMIKDKANIILLGPKLSGNHENYLKYVFGDDIKKFEAENTFAPLDNVLVVSTSTLMKYTKKSVFEFVKALREDNSNNSGLLIFSPTESKANRDFRILSHAHKNSLSVTYYDGIQKMIGDSPSKDKSEDILLSYTHGPIGMGVDLFWYKICIINTDTPKPKAALTADFVINQNIEAFYDLVVQDKMISCTQNAGRIMRIDPSSPERDHKVRRLLLLHGDDSDEIGEYMERYFKGVGHKIKHVHCDNSFEFLKELSLKFVSGQDIDSLARKGVNFFKNEYLLAGAKEDIKKLMEKEDNKDLKWGKIRSKLYSIKRLNKTLLNKIKEWFKEEYDVPRKERIYIAKIKDYIQGHKGITFRELTRKFSLHKKSDNILYAVKNMVSD
jgi:hypothetical protein